MKNSVEDFLEEIEKCEYIPDSTISIEDFKYNEIKYKEGTETYTHKLQKLYKNFKIYIRTDKTDAEEIYNELNELCNFYYDIPNFDTITRMQSEYSSLHTKNVSLKKSIDEAIFLNEMVEVQKLYLAKAKLFLEHIIKIKEEKTTNVSKDIKNSEFTHTTKTNKADAIYPQIISGVRNLAKYLGIGTTKASSIAKSEILPSTVQYKVGAKWCFNKKMLDDFICKNPKALKNNNRKDL